MSVATDSEREGSVPERVLVDGRAYRSSPRSEDELVQSLTEVDERARKDGEPLIATLYLDAGGDDTPFLSVGLGANESLLVYSSGKRNQESGFSKGPRADMRPRSSFVTARRSTSTCAGC